MTSHNEYRPSKMTSHNEHWPPKMTSRNEHRPSKMTLRNENRPRKTTSRISYTGTVCDIAKRTSVVKTGDYFRTTTTAAHELGHK
ncbi:hypothetical protein CHS0354_031620 [Potamilus streckersoni]|uniref:Uncharacterized protein n=1 Tax=Potamilus streckersoni TaxID=2493646 RepID=A0AAE0SGY8_9BIVA|nr:hypothetical protein CHS0354_031620 [Potamilus streckersoni]